MFWVNIKRVFRSGFVNFWRNGFVSLSSVLVMTVTLFVIGSGIFLMATLGASLNDLKSRVDINVYMAVGVPEEDILSLKADLEGLPEVKSVQYVSSDEELAKFKLRHEKDQSMLDALNELSDNPLGAVLNISANDPNQYETIANFLKSDSSLSGDKQVIVRKDTYNDNKTAIETLSRVIISAERLGFAVTLVLIMISVMIIFNTIRLAIYTARDEIAVMQLVGASNKYIRWPFIVSGIMYGLLSALITLAIFYPLTYWLGTATANFFNGINVFNYYIKNFSQIFGIIAGLGVFLGAVSSYLSVRRYLKV